jgi:hypothetical protein
MSEAQIWALIIVVGAVKLILLVLAATRSPTTGEEVPEDDWKAHGL